MKNIQYLIKSIAIFASIDIAGEPKVEVVIKAPEEEPEEEEKPELPEHSRLNFNVINQTELEYVIYVKGKVKGEDNQVILLQNKAKPKMTGGLGSLTADAEASFELVETQVIVLGTLTNFPVECQVRGPQGFQTAMDEFKKQMEDYKKLKEKAGVEMPQPPEFAAKKSIDFYFYLPADQELPACIIYFDTI